MITWNILQAAVLYFGFLAVLLWRLCFPWQTGKTWKKWFNHFTLLYLLVTVLYLFELGQFINTARKDFRASAEYSTAVYDRAHNKTLHGVVLVNGQREWPVYWLRVMVFCVPVVVPIIIVMTALQSKQHLQEIYQDSAQMQHDRVINILAMPAVYAVMAMSGLARIYDTVSQELINEESAVPLPNWNEIQSTSFAEYATCLYVGDLYEAWALYQFGKLSIDLLKDILPDRPYEEDTSSSHRPLHGLSIQAVSSSLWLGTGLFVIVNLVQAGWALYMWFFSDPAAHFDTFNLTLSQFSFAGMVASGGAIYNVYIVESTFGHFIKGFSPYLKFLSVKILVFFTFWQGPCLVVMDAIGILHVTDVQLKLLQASLLVWECFFCACLHVIAWGSQEQWFPAVDEKTPLLPEIDRSMIGA